ncbi:MAG: hypothetical protein JWQ97_738 [Phenylobacterium sp.]|nr:hypothetical protein [Phenylobacterium sp.]
MQSFSVLGVIAAAAALASTPACAQTSAAPPPDQAARAIVWRADSPLGGRSSAQLLRECQRVVEVIGPVTRYVSRGRELAPDALARCNRYATSSPVAAR